MSLSSIPAEILLEILQPKQFGLWPVYPTLQRDLHSWTLVCKRWKEILDRVVVDPSAVSVLVGIAPEGFTLKELAKIEKSSIDFDSVLFESCIFGHAKVAKLAFANGADPRSFDGSEYTESETLLIEAARWGHKSVVRVLLDYGEEITPNANGWTALHAATLEGHVEVVEYLMERGADITSPPDADYQPYGLAIGNGDEALLRTYLRRGPDILARQCHLMGEALAKSVRTKHMPLIVLLLENGFDQSVTQDLVLVWAIEAKKISVVELLLENGLPLPSPDPNVSLLCQAAESGHYSILRLLLENGGGTSQDGTHALFMAALSGHLAIAELLLEYQVHVKGEPAAPGLDPLSGAMESNDAKILQRLLEHGVFNQDMGSARTILHYAIERGRTPTIPLLLDLGADVSATTDPDSRTPLHVAAATGQIWVVDQLLDYGADVNAVDKNGVTALHLALALGGLELAELLLNRGADITARSVRNDTILHLIGHHLRSEHRPEEAAELLLARGADVTAVNSDRNTPLHLASKAGHAAVVVQLLDHGADITAVNCDNKTALHLAAYEGHRDLVELLLKHGVDVNAVDRSQVSALHMAVLKQNTSMVRLLLEAGASISARTRNGQTALHYAVHDKNLEIIGQLVENGADPDSPNEYGRTPRAFAVQSKHQDMLQLLGGAF